MAIIAIPYDFESQEDLLEFIIEKNEAEGARSVIAPLLKIKKIDLELDAVAAASNAACKAAYRKAICSSREALKQRDLLFRTIFAHIKGSTLFLKSLYEENPAQLLTWGITILDGGRISYAGSFLKKADMVKQFMEKHDSFPNRKSPLQPYLDKKRIHFVTDANNMVQAMKNHKDAKVLLGKANIFNKQCELIWKPVVKHLQVIADYLAKIYTEHPDKLIEWGFKINTHKTNVTTRNTKLKPETKKITSGISLGGVLLNTGLVEIEIYKGKMKKETLVVLKPGGQLNMVKGYSTITVFNPSALMAARYEVEVKVRSFSIG